MAIKENIEKRYENFILRTLYKHMSIRLQKHEVMEVPSWPAFIDIVLYKHNIKLLRNKIWRLNYIEQLGLNVVEAFTHISCLDSYSPEIINGKILSVSEDDVRIIDATGKVYKLEKNPEKIRKMID